MKDSLEAGIATTRRFEIDKERTIDFMGEEMRIYSTPSLLRDIEQTCREFLLEHLDEGEDTVGARVELDHLAATLLGMAVDISATVTGVEGRRIVLEVEAKDPLDVAGKAVHTRFVVDSAKQAARLQAKAAKAAEAS
jgi:predicted thioesterase